MTKVRPGPVSHLIDTRSLPRNGLDIEIVADCEQRRILADAHDLLSVERFSASLAVRSWRANGVRVVGTLEARIVQACVVTLEPVEAVIQEPVSATFVPEGSRLARDETEGGAFVLDAEGPDLPEGFSGTRIDVGALTEEFFVLAIDPYPRAPDAKIADHATLSKKEGNRGILHDKLVKLARKNR